MGHRSSHFVATDKDKTSDFSGGIAIDGDMTFGDASTDALTVTGAATFSNTVTVGEDDTGYDVTFYGATSGVSILWDESADLLSIVNAQITHGTSGTQNTHAINNATWRAFESSWSVTQTAASDNSFRLMQRHVTTGGDMDETTVRIGYDRIDLDHHTGKSAYLWDGRFDIGSGGYTDEAAYGGAIELIMGNATAMGSDLFGFYCLSSGAGAGGVTGNFMLFAAIPNSTAAVDSCFHGAPAASGSATNAFSVGGEGALTNVINVTMGSTGATNFIKFGADDQKNCVDTSAACATTTANSDAAIKIDIAGTAYYIPAYTAGNTTGSW